MDIRQLLTDATRHHRAGQFAEAEAIYRNILSVSPDHADSLNLLGVIASQRGEHQAAIDLIGRAIALRKQNPAAEFHNNIGLAFRALRQPDDAMSHFQRAVALKPAYPDALNNLGAVLEEEGRLDEAAKCFRRVLSFKPDNAKAHYCLGKVFKRQNRLDEAALCYERTIDLKPDYAEAHNNLGQVREDQGRLDEAATCYRRALAFKPGYAKAQYNLGHVLAEQGRIEEAITAYQRAAAITPDDADIHWNEALLRLLRGEFAIGWEKYEWRWKRKEFPGRDFIQPRWNGEATNKTILLYAEQGLGDTIQFCRYATLAASRGRIVLEVPKPLATVLSGLPGVDAVVAKGSPLPHFDLHCPLMSVPGLFGTELETIPGDVPYLHADPAKIAEWAPRLSELTGLKVSLVWAGSPGNTKDGLRSIPAGQFLTLTDVEGASFYSLQTPIPESDEAIVSAAKNLHLSPVKISNFEDSAVIAQLDLVIAVDTSTAHLAAAMGKPVWVLLQWVPHWAWMLDRDDSPWYPTVRLFRQTRAGDWTDVLERVKTALIDLVASRRT